MKDNCIIYHGRCSINFGIKKGSFSDIMFLLSTSLLSLTRFRATVSLGSVSKKNSIMLIELCTIVVQK